MLKTVRRDHSPLESILNGDSAASPLGGAAQTWCSLFVAPCAPEATPPGPSLAVTLLDELFEHPVRSFSFVLSGLGVWAIASHHK
jgi:hypothetical protein